MLINNFYHVQTCYRDSMFCHGKSLAPFLLAVTIWKLGRTVCVYSMVQRREKEKDSRYIQEASAPAAVPCVRPVISCTSVTVVVTYPVASDSEWRVASGEA